MRCSTLICRQRHGAQAPQHAVGGKSGRSITRYSKGLRVIQQLNAAKEVPGSPQPHGGRVIDLTSDAPEGFGLLSDEPSISNDTDDQEEHGKAVHDLSDVEEEDDGSERANC